MIWTIPLLIAILCTMINPYVGMFGIFLIVEFLVYMGLYSAITVRMSLGTFDGSVDMEAYQQKLIGFSKRCTVLWCVLSVVMLVITTIVFVIVWGLASGVLTDTVTVATPFDVFSDNSKYSASVVLLIISIICNAVTTVLVFAKRKVLSKVSYIKAKNRVESETDNDKNGKRDKAVIFRVNVLLYCILIIAIVTGMLNQNIGWFSFVLHFWYLFLIGLTYFLISTSKWVSRRKSSTARLKGSYSLEKMTKGNWYNNALILVAFFICVLVVAMEVILNSILKVNAFGIIHIGYDIVFLAVSCCCNIIVAIMYVKAVRNIQ